MVVGKKRRNRRTPALAELTSDFWTMQLVDHIAERTPRTRSADMDQCRQLVAAYLDAHPTALPTAIAAVERTGRWDLGGVIDRLDPPFHSWVKQHIPDLLERPAGLY